MRANWRQIVSSSAQDEIERLLREGLTIAAVAALVGEKKSHVWSIGTERGAVRAKPKHPLQNSQTHTSWRKMRERCLTPTCPQYRYYGGRGITICERWLSFANFVLDMGVRPPDTSLDRIDPNGNYEPNNCRWATLDIQKRNQRHTLKHNGDFVSAIAERNGIPMGTVRSRFRMYGESVEQALVGRYRNKKQTPEALREFVAMRKRGLKYREIAPHFGVAVETLEKWSSSAKRQGLL